MFWVCAEHRADNVEMLLIFICKAYTRKPWSQTLVQAKVKAPVRPSPDPTDPTDLTSPFPPPGHAPLTDRAPAPHKPRPHAVGPPRPPATPPPARTGGLRTGALRATANCPLAAPPALPKDGGRAPPGETAGSAEAAGRGRRRRRERGAVTGAGRAGRGGGTAAAGAQVPRVGGQRGGGSAAPARAAPSGTPPGAPCLGAAARWRRSADR